MNTRNIEWKVTAFTAIAEFFKQEKNSDSVIYYANTGYNIAYYKTKGTVAIF